MHAFDICFDLASKMKNPHEVVSSMNDKIKRGQFLSPEWPLISLAWGLSGITCFYAMMEFNFPDEGWEKVVYDYLLIAKEIVERDSISDLSLYSGLTGLSAVVHLSSHNGSRYHKTLSALDDLLIREVQTGYLSHTNHYLNPYVPIPPNHYNLANGLCGMLIYFMNREDSVVLKNLAQDCLYSLVETLSVVKEINGSRVPAWYVSSEHESILEYKEKYSKGHFKLNIPNGLPGVLAALSLAKIKGYHAPGLVELIAKMADWILKKQIIHEQQMNWNHLVSMEEELEEITSGLKIQHRAWFYGALGILRCLYLSARAVNDSNLAKFSEKAFLSIVVKPDPENEMKDLSFSFGKAGLLAMTYEMACDTKNPEFFKQSRVLEEEIKKDHHPNHEFGFQTLLYDDKGSLKWSNNPSLLNGAAGIGLTLLRVQGKQEILWSHPFVIA